jgi:hypothetical protein
VTDQGATTSRQGRVRPLFVETAAQVTRRSIDAVKIELDQLCKNPPENLKQREEELTRLLFRLDDIDVCDSENQARRRKMIAKVQAVLKEPQKSHTVNQSKTYAQVAKQGNPGNTKNMSQSQKNIAVQNKKRPRDSSNSSHNGIASSSSKAASSNVQVVPQPLKNKMIQGNKNDAVSSDSPYSNPINSSSKSINIPEISQSQDSQILHENKKKKNEASSSLSSDQSGSSSIVESILSSQQTVLWESRKEQTEIYDVSHQFKHFTASNTQSDIYLASESSFEFVMDDQSQVNNYITDNPRVTSLDPNLVQEAVTLESNISIGDQAEVNVNETENLITKVEIVDEQLDGMEAAEKFVTSGDCQILTPVKATGEIATCPMGLPDSPKTTQTQECDPLRLDTSGTITEQEEGPLQLLIQDQQSGKFVLNQEALSRVLANVKHQKLAIISIVGAFRRGKSFLLNFLLRYLEQGVSFFFLSINWFVRRVLKICVTFREPQTGWTKVLET